MKHKLGTELENMSKWKLLITTYCTCLLSADEILEGKQMTCISTSHTSRL